MKAVQSLLILAVTLFSGISFAEGLVEIPMKYVPNLKQDIVLANGFTPHRGFAGTGFRMEPLHQAHSPMDYKAWHDESWNDLTVIYDRAWSWPREMSEAQNASDLEIKHYAKFLSQEWVSYTVMTPDGDRVIGSLYITPQACGKYGASAMFWITTPVRKDIEATFHAETKKWLDTVWPWKNTYYPGPELTDDQRGEVYKKIEAGICE